MYFLSVGDWTWMYTPNTFHNMTLSTATTANAESTATLVKVILISRSTWFRPRRALGGYRLAHDLMNNC